MQKSELITETRHMLDELTESESHWSDTRLTIWLDEGQEDGVTRFPAPLLPKLADTVLKNLSTRVSDYTFDVERIRIDAVLLNYMGEPSKNSDYNVARIVDISFINALNNNILYEPTTSQPYVTIHGNTLTIYPEPLTAAINGMKIFFIRPPTDLSNDTDVPEIPQFAHRWLTIYAASKALQEDGDERYKVLYDQYLEKFKKYEVK